MRPISKLFRELLKFFVESLPLHSRNRIKMSLRHLSPKIFNDGLLSSITSKCGIQVKRDLFFNILQVLYLQLVNIFVYSCLNIYCYRKIIFNLLHNNLVFSGH